MNENKIVDKKELKYMSKQSYLNTNHISLFSLTL